MTVLSWYAYLPVADDPQNHFVKYHTYYCFMTNIYHFSNSILTETTSVAIFLSGRRDTGNYDASRPEVFLRRKYTSRNGNQSGRALLTRW